MMAKTRRSTEKNEDIIGEISRGITGDFDWMKQGQITEWQRKSPDKGFNFNEIMADPVLTTSGASSNFGYMAPESISNYTLSMANTMIEK